MNNNSTAFSRPSSHKDNVSDEHPQPLVKVTLQSLKGINYRITNKDCNRQSSRISSSPRIQRENESSTLKPPRRTMSSSSFLSDFCSTDVSTTDIVSISSSNGDNLDDGNKSIDDEGINYLPTGMRKNLHTPTMTRSTSATTTTTKAIPHVAAAVSFSGSAPDMQVGSSIICGRTGNLLVESQAATVLSPASPLTRSESSSSCESEKNKTKTIPLIANWDTNTQGVGASSSFSSSRGTPSSSIEKPHLTMRLPRKNGNLPTSSLPTRMNPFSTRLHPSSTPPDLADESDLSNSSHGSVDRPQDNTSIHTMPPLSGEEGEVEIRATKSMLSDTQKGDGIVWLSSQDSGMPEVIELNVSLNILDKEKGTVDDDDLLDTDSNSKRSTPGTSKKSNAKDIASPEARTSWNSPVSSKPLRKQQIPEEGVARLVFYGLDAGTTILDLPVTRKLPARKNDYTDPTKASDVSAGGDCNVNGEINSKHNDTTSIFLQDEAYLRVKVEVFPDGKEPVPQTIENLYSKSLLGDDDTNNNDKSTHHRRVHSFYEGSKKALDPIIQQLRLESDQDQEQQQQQLLQKMKEQQQQQQQQPEYEPFHNHFNNNSHMHHRSQTHSGIFCSSNDELNIFSIFQEIKDSVTRCADADGVGNNPLYPYKGKNNNNNNIYYTSGDSIASTIETSPSLLI